MGLGATERKEPNAEELSASITKALCPSPSEPSENSDRSTSQHTPTGLVTGSIPSSRFAGVRLDS